MIQLSHFWVFIWRKWNTNWKTLRTLVEKIYASRYSLFTKAKIWKSLCVYIILLNCEKEGNLAVSTTWGSWGYYTNWNVRQRETSYNFIYMWNIKTEQMNKPNKHRCGKQMGGCQRGREQGVEWMGKGG